MHSTGALKLLVGACSDIGPRRSANEDSGYGSDRLLAVADGVGGSVAGELASSLVVRGLADGFGAVPNPDGRAVLTQVAGANARLTAAIREDAGLRGMATTLTGLVVSGESGFLVHVGDSRAYRWRDGTLELMTVDQSWVQMLIDEGMLDPADAPRHPMRNLLLHSLSGSLSDIDAVRITRVDLRLGDRWLVATDGLTSYLPLDALADLMDEVDDPQELADDLVRQAWSRTRDNITALVGDVTVGTAIGEGSFVGAADELGRGVRRVV